MADERVWELIANEFAPGGAIHSAISQLIAASVNNDGVVHTAVTNDVATAVSNSIATEAEGNILHAIRNDFDSRADREFPWRAKLRGMGPAEFTAAWKNLVVDPDHLHALSQAISDDPQMATIMALEAANPNNAELVALRRHASMKHAPKISWKSLCLPHCGGGTDRLQVFLTERGEVGEESTRALARSVLAIYHLVEKRHTVQQNLKKGGPEKAEAQRKELMGIVYETIKAYKRRTTKPSASNDFHTEIFMKDFGMDPTDGPHAAHHKGVSCSCVGGPDPISHEQWRTFL